MVIYDLQCVLGHRFEGWFPNSDSFKTQQDAGMVACSQCGCTEVVKIPSGGHIGQSFKKREVQVAPTESSDVSQNQTVNIDPIVFLKAVNQFVKANFKNVGEEFTQKAVAMHRGLSPKEPICGTTTPEDRETLEEEGVDFTPLPKLPESAEN